MPFLGYLGFLVGLVGIITLIFHWSARSQYGSSIARELLPQQFVTAISIVIASTLPSFAKGDQGAMIIAVVVASCTVLLWITLAVLVLRKSKTGTVLLNLGRLNKHPEWILLCFGLLGTIMLLIGIGLSTRDIAAISFGALMWSFGIVFTVTGRKDTLLTEKGIRTGYTGFEWEQVKSYMWASAGKGDHYLFFKIKNRLPLLNTSLLKIAAEQQQSVSDIVLQRTHNVAFTPEATSKEVAH